MGKPAKIPLDYLLIRNANDLMRALAHPLRLRILELLYSSPDVSVQTIYTELGIEQSVASQHLRILRQASLVWTHRKGKFIYYLPNEQRLIKAAQVSEKLAQLVREKDDE